MIIERINDRQAVATIWAGDKKRAPDIPEPIVILNA
jgi:hypothetical protein